MPVKSSYLWVWDHALPSFTERARNSEPNMQKKQKRLMLYFDNNSTRQSLTFLRPPLPLSSAHVTPCPARETKIRRMLQQRERGGKEGHQWKGNRLRAEQNRMGQARGLMGWRMNTDEQKHCSVASLHTSGLICRDTKNRKEKKKSNTDITLNWVGGDLVTPNTFIFICRLAQNKSCCISFKQMPH